MQQAAVELFGERGYDQTTATDIAARAGVTQRTFFHHFADKREVLFSGQEMLRSALTEAVAQAPAGLTPLAVLYRAFRSIEKPLEDNRSMALPRQQVIDRTPALQERELAKMAALAEALTLGLRARGVGERQAALAARVGMAAFTYAILSWFADPAGGLGAHFERTFRELDAMAI